MPDSIPLRDHFEALLREIENRNQERFQAQADAITKAEEALAKRLEALNELRGDVATRSQIGAVEQRLNDMVERLNRIEGRSSGIGSSVVTFIAVASFLAAALGLYLRH